MFKVLNNYYDSDLQRRVVVLQTESKSLQIITADFDNHLVDWTKLSDKELIHRTLEWFYRTYMQGKFLNEAVEIAEAKAREAEQLANNIKESAELIQSLNAEKEELARRMELMDKAIAKSEQMSEKNNELIKTVTLTMNELVAELLSGDDNEAIEEDPTV